MALFFDSEWFDARLAAAGLTRATVAAALGLPDAAVAEMWKDQRELSADDVRILSLLLAVPVGEIASRAGVSTPIPKDVPETGELAARLTGIERSLAEIKALLLELRTRR
ncbi:MAG: hypothetical protein WDM91_21065 [Rhizomicrobium sp.]